MAMTTNKILIFKILYTIKFVYLSAEYRPS